MLYEKWIVWCSWFIKNIQEIQLQNNRTKKIQANILQRKTTKNTILGSATIRAVIRALDYVIINKLMLIIYFEVESFLDRQHFDSIKYSKFTKKKSILLYWRLFTYYQLYQLSYFSQTILSSKLSYIHN